MALIPFENKLGKSRRNEDTKVLQKSFDDQGNSIRSRIALSAAFFAVNIRHVAFELSLQGAALDILQATVAYVTFAHGKRVFFIAFHAIQNDNVFIRPVLPVSRLFFAIVQSLPGDAVEQLHELHQFTRLVGHLHRDQVSMWFDVPVVRCLHIIHVHVRREQQSSAIQGEVVQVRLVPANNRFVSLFPKVPEICANINLD